MSQLFAFVSLVRLANIYSYALLFTLVQFNLIRVNSNTFNMKNMLISYQDYAYNATTWN